jgi:hypothetical protein
MDTNEDGTGHYHKICLETFIKERQRAEFSETRLKNLEVSIRYLALKMDGIEGHHVYDSLGGHTLGGAVRALIIKE